VLQKAIERWVGQAREPIPTGCLRNRGQLVMDLGPSISSLTEARVIEGMLVGKV
jgi:hypothetical protein